MSDDEPTPRNPAAVEETAHVDLTEAYARLIADKLSEALPEGMRFEWGDPAD